MKEINYIGGGLIAWIGSTILIGAVWLIFMIWHFFKQRKLNAEWKSHQIEAERLMKKKTWIMTGPHSAEQWEKWEKETLPKEWKPSNDN